MKKNTLVTFRQVADAIKDKSVAEIAVPKAMIDSCCHARHRYQLYLDQQKAEREVSAADRKRKELQQELSDAKRRKVDLQK